MKKIPRTAALLIAVSLVSIGHYFLSTEMGIPPSIPHQAFHEIAGEIKKGETLSQIFKKYSLNIGELDEMRRAAVDVYRLKALNPGRSYRIVLDDAQRIVSFVYGINDDNFLKIRRTSLGYHAEKVPISYEKRMLSLGGMVKGNLIASLEGGGENLLLALKLSDIFAWDIDFNTDLRNHDSFKIIAEGLYLDGHFKRYGNILAAEFSNGGEVYRAYAFEQNGRIGYYDDVGTPLKKAFLKAPLSFRYVSSRFSSGRYHPILKITRPHQGLDYAAATGTPVSAIGDGTVLFAGRRGAYGKLIIIKHRNGYQTYYGHLSQIATNVRNGVKVDQGSIIGYVGATGLATGPHLHYEVRIDGRPVNPTLIKAEPGMPIPGDRLADFRRLRDRIDPLIAAIKPSERVAAGAAAIRGGRTEG
ncbi:MAG: peptidoglycan DD-metalloendopeptidase family protein [Syntrophales bacterium]